MTRPATFDHLSKRNGKVRKVQVCTDEDALDALAEAEAALERLTEAETTLAAARKADKDIAVAEAAVKAAGGRKALTDARDAAQAAVDEATVEMTFASIGRKAWERLIDQHPPTEDQVIKAKDAGDEEPGYDVESFAVAAVAACCVDPPMTIDQAQELYDTWNSPEFGQLFTAAIIANSQSRIVPFRPGSAGTRT